MDRGQSMRKGLTWNTVLRKYHSMKLWLLAAIIVAACMAYPLALLGGLLWAMARIAGMV
jgi:hypothetical protein